MSPSNVPAKKVCQMATPEGFKSSGGVLSSTPLCSKSLRFENLTIGGECKEIRVCNVPTPFMEVCLSIHVSSDCVRTITKEIFFEILLAKFHTCN